LPTAAFIQHANALELIAIDVRDTEQQQLQQQTGHDIAIAVATSVCKGLVIKHDMGYLAI